jgi:hypothetical protein
MIEGNPSYERSRPTFDPQALRRVPPGARQVVVPFVKCSGRALGPDSTTLWRASPMMEVLPLGLVVFDAAADAVVLSIGVGNQSHGIASYEGVPARYFGSNLSFAQLEKLAEAGELGKSQLDRCLFELGLCEVGNTLRVETTGEMGAIAVWGLQHDGYRSVRDVRIWRETASGPLAGAEPSYRAEVVDQTLVGSRLRFGVNTETEAAAVELVKSFLTGYRG